MSTTQDTNLHDMKNSDEAWAAAALTRGQIALAFAAIPLSFLFAWGFLRLMLMLVFPPATHGH